MKRSIQSLCLAATLLSAACNGGNGGNGGSGQGSSEGIPSPPVDSGPTTTFSLRALIDKVLAEDNRFESDASEAQPAVFVSNNSAGNPTLAATTQYIEAAIKHADTIWTQWFIKNGLQEPWVGYQIVQSGQQYTSKCPLAGRTVFASDFPNAFYCSTDMNTTDSGMLVFPVQTMAKMWTGNVFEHRVSSLKRVGDFAAGVLVGHEFGHHIQDELSQQLQRPRPVNANLELIADCFAGVWTYSVFLDNYLEAGDTEEALNALEAIGDNLGSHGTPEQRKNAFLIGFTGTQAYPQGGVPENCIKAYWP